MATKRELLDEQGAQEEHEYVDVTTTMVKMYLPRPNPGEEDAIFVSDGRQNILVKKGVEVEVPYWAYQRLQQMMDAQHEADAYNRYSSALAERMVK